MGKKNIREVKKSVAHENITARDVEYIYLPTERVKSPRWGTSVHYDTGSSTLN